MGEQPRPSEDPPKTDWSHVDDLYRDFKKKEKAKKEKTPSPTEKILLGEDVDGLNADTQKILREQLEKEKQQNEQRRQVELEKARTDLGKKWNK